MEAKAEPVIVTVDEEDQQLQALMRHASELFTEYVKNHRQLPPEVLSAYENLDDPIRKLYYAAANVQQKVDVKQKVLEAENITEQFVQLIQLISSELEMIKLETEIDTKVQDQIAKSQRKYFIQEQIRALQNELGDDDDGGSELGPLKEQLESAGMPEEVYATRRWKSSTASRRRPPCRRSSG